MEVADDIVYRRSGRIAALILNDYFAEHMRNLHPRLIQIGVVLENIRVVLSRGRGGR